MDLFGDLPPPSTNTSTGKLHVHVLITLYFNVVTLFDDLPAVKKDLVRPTNHERQDSDIEQPPTKKVKIGAYLK